jgi:hypothetical protein
MEASSINPASEFATAFLRIREQPRYIVAFCLLFTRMPVLLPLGGLVDFSMSTNTTLGQLARTGCPGLSDHHGIPRLFILVSVCPSSRP